VYKREEEGFIQACDFSCKEKIVEENGVAEELKRYMEWGLLCS
jgi:hypothetical protein